MFKFNFIFFIIFSISSALGYEPFAEEKVDKEFYIQRYSMKPKIDGFIEESEWSSILPINDFMQEDPLNMNDPSEQTEVFLTYDDESLYIAARLYDSEPDKIMSQLAPRDDWYNAFDEMADWFSINIDSRHDHMSGYSFAVNASGVLSDEMVYHDEEFDNNWNAIWEAEVNIDDTGWTIEMEIPFSNFPFYKNDELVWGLNFTRFIQRKYETISWVVFPLDVDGIVSQYGHLKGLENIYPPAKFELKPYNLISNTNFSDIRLLDYENPLSHRTNFSNEPNYNLGLDMQYRVNTNSKLTFTFNPDFGQVESDPADVNLTAYETYFEDRRPFFMNDIDIFETPIEIFYSRRIGERAWSAGYSNYLDTLRSNISSTDCVEIGGSLIGNSCIDSAQIYYDVPVTIKAAAKLTGKTESGFSYGFLSALTSLNEKSESYKLKNDELNRSYFVSRIKQDFSKSSIGFMTTSSLYDSSNIYSLDGNLNLLENKVSIESQLLTTNNKNKSLYIGTNYSPFWFLDSWVEYHRYDDNISLNSLGYLWRDNYVQNRIGLKYNFEHWQIIRDGSIIVEHGNENNLNSLSLGENLDISFSLKFNNSWSLSGGTNRIKKHNDDRKIILDTLGVFGPPIIIPEVIASSFSISSAKHLNFWFSMSYSYASNSRSDVEENQYFEINYRPSSHLNFVTSYNKYMLDKQFHWLESFVENDGYHHIFSDLKRQLESVTFRMTSNINKKIILENYLEIFNNLDTFDSESYKEFDIETKMLVKTDYISGTNQWNGMPVYTKDVLNLSESYLDPNLYNGLYSKYTSMVFNSRIKWNYIKGSNIYLVYSATKTVNGKPFSGMGGLVEFIKFNEKKSWVETLRDQTIMIKIDYWFEI